MVSLSKSWDERWALNTDRFNDLSSRLDDILQALKQVQGDQQSLAAATDLRDDTDVGESESLSVLITAFPWIKPETLKKFEDKKFTIDDFVKLRSPTTVVSLPPPKKAHISFQGEGNVRFEVAAEGDEDNINRTLQRFVTAVPNIAALSQLWSIYMALACFYSPHERHHLHVSLTKFLVQLIEADAGYEWSAICGWFVDVCVARFNTADAATWGIRDVESFQVHTADRRKRRAEPQSSATLAAKRPRSGAGGGPTGGGGGPSSASAISVEVCRTWNLGGCSGGCKRAHICLLCKGDHRQDACPSRLAGPAKGGAMTK